MSSKRPTWSRPKWAALRAEIFRAADFTCADCGWAPRWKPPRYDGKETLREWTHADGKADYTELQVDHIQALAAGGTHDRENLQVLCNKCNGRKWSKVAA